MRLLCTWILIIANGGLVGAEQQVDVPDPFGLGERLAILDYLHEHKITAPSNPTIEQLRTIFLRSKSNGNSLGNDTPVDATAERDRCMRLRESLKKDYSVIPPDGASEVELSRIIAEHRKERDLANFKAMKEAAATETNLKIGGNWVGLLYNKFENITTAYSHIRDARMSEKGEDSPIIPSSVMLFKGLDLSQKAYSTKIAFRSMNDKWRFLENHEVIMLVDGIRLVYKGVHHGDIQKDATIKEEVDIELPSEDEFYILSHAKVIEAQIGGEKFVFDAQTHEELLELSGVMERLRRYDAERLTRALFTDPDSAPKLDCALLDRLYEMAHFSLTPDGSNDKVPDADQEKISSEPSTTTSKPDTPNGQEKQIKEESK